MIRYIKTFEVIFSTNNLSGMHISTMWHSLNVLKYFCPLSVYMEFHVPITLIQSGQTNTQTHTHTHTTIEI